MVRHSDEVFHSKRIHEIVRNSYRSRNIPYARELLRRDAFADAIRCLDGAIQWCLRKDYSEFLPAVPRSEIDVPTGCANGFGDGPNHHISARMAEPVVDFLQKIEIDD